jgi:hypothetical protein
MRIYKQVRLGTNVSTVVEEHKQINNQPAQYKVKKNERTFKQISAAAQTNSCSPVQNLPVKEFKRKFLIFQQTICPTDNQSSSVTS